MALPVAALRFRAERGVAANNNRVTKNPINRNGIHATPHPVGPKGVIHKPPPQENRNITKKNQKKLFQGPRVPKARPKSQAIPSPTNRAYIRCVIIIIL
jgi:hypothetical protein